MASDGMQNNAFLEASEGMANGCLENSGKACNMAFYMLLKACNNAGQEAAERHAQQVLSRSC